MTRRVLKLTALFVASWYSMVMTHELGHIVGGWCCGARLSAFELRPWRLPYSFFDPDPQPLITLWAGLLAGVLVPMATAWLLRRDWAWFVANFCVLANATYIALGLVAGDSELDTTKLLNNGAHPASIWLYCAITLPIGYVGFRNSCNQILADPQSLDANSEHA